MQPRIGKKPEGFMADGMEERWLSRSGNFNEAKKKTQMTANAARNIPGGAGCCQASCHRRPGGFDYTGATPRSSRISEGEKRASFPWE
ncbi:uncharacterized protein LOC144113528 isoform X2 [Amblyomma americanum]